MKSPPTCDPRSIRFVLDGEIICVGDLPATTTVLEYLRTAACRTGTKEGCAEGDCGACTIVLGELSSDTSSIRYHAINSCIRFLPTLDGQELVTVESLADPDGPLHPVQQALVDHHGSQCGFCTPGFVMSLLALYLQSENPAREEVVTALAGNLCRCTGYRPIIDAGLSLHGYPQPARWSRAEAQSPAHIQRLLSLQRPTALQLPGFAAPRSVDELARALGAEPGALILAGGTDIGLWTTQELRELPPIVYLGAIPELKEIRETEAGLWIGAGVSLTLAWAALTREHPELSEQAQRFASPPICNSGTLCGNIANGSPIGDSMPALIALGAELELRCGSQTRHLPLERFYLSYRKTDLAPGEFVVAVRVPRNESGTFLASYKLAKRFDQDISGVCAAFAVRVIEGQILSARLAFGALAAIPARALHAEQALLGRPWGVATIAAAGAALAQDFQPLTDFRASRDYRLQAAGNLLQRFYLEHSPSATPVRVTALSELEPG
jgi:xanthine dehydrogenase small subunit